VARISLTDRIDIALTDDARRASAVWWLARAIRLLAGLDRPEEN
jgi:hypothetical protein